MTAFSRSYAQAFLGAAPSGYDVDTFLEQAHDLQRAIDQEPRLRAFFATPAIPAAAKAKTLAALAQKTGADDFGRRFLDLLLKNRRLLALPAILTALREEADRQSGVVEAQVTVASPIEEEDGRRITAALERAVSRRVRLSTRVDPGILGGFVARVGSEVFDASVRRAVEQFEQEANEGAKV